VYHYVAAQSSLTVKVADAHVQTLVAVVKMATMFEECITKEQRSVVRFFAVKMTQCKGYS
jgi:hypothetical protein